MDEENYVKKEEILSCLFDKLLSLSTFRDDFDSGSTHIQTQVQNVTFYIIIFINFLRGRTFLVHL